METASEASSEQDYSYEFAQMEVIMKTLGNNGMISIICNPALYIIALAYGTQLYTKRVKFTFQKPSAFFFPSSSDCIITTLGLGVYARCCQTLLPSLLSF